METSFGSLNVSRKGRGAKPKNKSKNQQTDDNTSNPQPKEPEQEIVIDESGLATMSKSEMMQHLQLCIQLAAANKINMKNAFGLHLIGIMRQLFKDQKTPDLQQASLSLQASSKIYAGRVDALYQDTYQFHSHLQTIVSGGKNKDSSPKETNADDSIADLEDDGGKRHKGTEKRKCKSYLVSEESITSTQGNTTSRSGMPHANFIRIKSAFNASRTAKKLLHSLEVLSDSSKLMCATSVPCFKPKKDLNCVKYQSKIDILKNVSAYKFKNTEFDAISCASTVYSPVITSTPMYNRQKAVGLDIDFSIAPDANSPVMAENNNDVDSVIGRLSVLDITPNVFIQNISHAITSEGVLDRNLLPPNSAVKKMLDDNEKSLLTKKPVKKKREKKVKEPFFLSKSIEDVQAGFVQARGKITCSNKTVQEWNILNTSILNSDYDAFATLLGPVDDNNMTTEEKNEKAHAYMFEAFMANDCKFLLSHYFLKRPALWNRSLKKSRPSIRPSTVRGEFDDHKKESLTNGENPLDCEDLVNSLKNLSLNDSMEINYFGNDDGDSIDRPDRITEAASIFQLPSSFPNSNDSEINRLLVAPPELVKPPNVKYETKPMSLNTEKVKKFLWDIISRRLNESKQNSSEPILFTDVYKELVAKLTYNGSEHIPLQFAFVMVLILANEKILLLENVDETSNFSIRQDICEINSD